LTVRTGVATVYVMSVRFEMRVDDALMGGIDAVRGNETRAAWIKRTLAAALREPKGGRPSEAGESAGSTPAPSASAPQRAPALPGVKSAAELFAEQCRAKGR
jgi:hypothetical protein